MLTIGILITASSVSAEPQGTVIKEGVLTYPAGPYLSEDPLLLSLENYTGDNDTQTLPEQSEITYLENGSLFLENNSLTITSVNLIPATSRFVHPIIVAAIMNPVRKYVSLFRFFVLLLFSFSLIQQDILISHSTS